MPYITVARRKEIGNGGCPENPGELNYKLTKEILSYLSWLNYKKLVPKKGEIPKVFAVNNYADYNEVIGVLRLVELELWDRLIRPYEKKKRDENGDVF